MFLCPADAQASEPWDFGPFRVAFTSYLGVEGLNQRTRDGLLYQDSATTLTSIADGTSNTLLVGERPPSADHINGWWYAGWGQSKDGSADMLLGAREVFVDLQYRRCPPVARQFGPGHDDWKCDVFHFWSFHPGGAHFLFADGSVRFLRYDADAIMPALATRAGGKAVSLD